ncbi:C6 transcription factor [Penicillium riverlandense]|uniref:C6 transcription factor n=1 Tax=Penicillium riverlandense TaxID=1903569 RepID=UPI00254807B0|nr:C6 transcription factor [Penicillium riverlandense]KAJ5811770.1 C6 transcription factor [Penicillium riverlandense]
MSTSTSVPEDFLAAVAAKHSAPLWTVLSKMVPPHPNPKASAEEWKFDELKPLLMEAGRIVGAEEADRRVLMLVNPSMEAPYTTDTIYAGLQLILPGETAPAHRHVAFALRFIIEGEGGFTAVEGRKISMSRGDLILTPSWHWHDHGNEGNKPIIWLDGLDLPLFRNVPVNFAENYTEPRYPSQPVSISSQSFPWHAVQKALDFGTGPYALYHYHRIEGRHLSASISAQAERVAAGHTTNATRDTCSFVYHIHSGCGTTRIRAADGGEKVIQWKEKDTFAVPAWSEVQHTAVDTSYLFAINDRPMVESLGLHRQSS